jgi:O-antigen ligase
MRKSKYMILDKNKKIAALLIIPALALLSILLLSQENFIFSLFLIIFYCVFTIAFFNNKTGLYLILLLRPCLDYFTGSKIIFWRFSFNLAGIFAGLTIILSLFVILKNLKKNSKAPLKKAWIIFLIPLLLSLFFTSAIRTGITEIARYISIILIFYSAFLLTENNKDLAKTIKIIILSAIIPSIAAVWQYLAKTGLTIPFEGVYNRVYGTFAHPNLLAFYLLLAISLCLVVFLVSEKKQITILFYGLLSILFLISLGFTYTRSAWIGLALIVFMLGLTRYRKFLLIAVLAMIIGYFSIEQINTRLSSFTLKDPSSSVQWRLNLWKDEARLISKKPLFGYGAGTSDDVILRDRGSEAGSSAPHNDYLRIALEAGLIGLGAFLAFIFLVLKNLFLQYKKQTKPRLKTLSFVVFILIGGFYLISFGDNILANTALQWALWALLGGMLANKQLKTA